MGDPQHPFMRRARSLLLLFLAVSSASASAQWAALNSINSDVRHQGMMRSYEQQWKQGDKDSAGAVPHVDQATNAQALTYRISAQRRQAFYAKVVAQRRKTDPAGAAGLAANLRTDPLAKAAPRLASVGFAINIVGDAYAAYWIEAWAAANQLPMDAGSVGQTQAVQKQAASLMQATPEVARAGDAEKQELAEALWLQMMMLGAAREKAQGDPAQLRAIAKAVRQGALRFGMDLDAVTLTETGFVRSSKLGMMEATSARQSGSGVALAAGLLAISVGGLRLVRNRQASG